MSTKQLYFLSLGVQFWFSWRSVAFLLHKVSSFSSAFPSSWITPPSYWNGGSFPRITKMHVVVPSFCHSPSRNCLTPASHVGVSVSCGWRNKTAQCFWALISSCCLEVSDEEGDLEGSWFSDTPSGCGSLPSFWDNYSPPNAWVSGFLWNEVTCFIPFFLPFQCSLGALVQLLVTWILFHLPKCLDTAH